MTKIKASLKHFVSDVLIWLYVFKASKLSVSNKRTVMRVGNDRMRDVLFVGPVHSLNVLRGVVPHAFI